MKKGWRVFRIKPRGKTQADSMWVHVKAALGDRSRGACERPNKVGHRYLSQHKRLNNIEAGT